MNFHKGLMLLLLAAVFAVPAFAQEEAKTENWLEKRFGKELVNAKGEKVATATLKGKTVGIYFSAHWCPPCRKPPIGAPRAASSRRSWSRSATLSPSRILKSSS